MAGKGRTGNEFRASQTKHGGLITMQQSPERGSKRNLLGENPKPELVELFSNEKQVTDKTPPAFLAHAQNDTVVPPIESQRFYEALRAHHVAAEYLQLPEGGHGLNGYKGPMWTAWQTKSLAWLAAQKFIPLTAAPDAKDPGAKP